TTIIKLGLTGKGIWTNNLPGLVYGMTVNSSGETFIAGTVSDYGRGTSSTISRLAESGVPFTGQGAAFVAKLDSSGSIEWMRLDGQSETSRLWRIALDDEGNYYVIGDY